MYHLELRQFPHSARAFNLTGEELRLKFLAPWLAGQTVEWGERRWQPERARLTIYEGPRLRPDELGMGRGWSNATRSGRDVTADLFADAERAAATAPIAQLKRFVLERSAGEPREVREAARLAAELWPERRAGERLGLAEQAVWELLHEGRLELFRDAGATRSNLAENEWQPALLAWETWTGETRLPLRMLARA